MKVWQRRFALREENPILEAFNSSIAVDRFLYAAEIDATSAYAKALCRASVLTGGELEEIEQGLIRVKKRIEDGEDLSRFEDIHSAVEFLLVEEVGQIGKKIHTGRSRNEQVVTDERLYLKDKIPQMTKLLTHTQRTLIDLAVENLDIVMPGYTHLQPAQCVLFAHYLMSLFWPLERAKSRLREIIKRVDTLALGVGALAGATIPIDREHLCRDLGFSSITDNSMDTVADRSFILEILFALSLLLLDLSRYAEDFVLFSTQEFGYLILDESIATSSSLMPQKKNPDFFELIRSSGAKLFGHLSNLFITLKGLPSTYNRDLQNDKTPLKEGMEEALRALEVFRFALSRIKPDKEKIQQQLKASLFATDMVDYLVEKRVPFREAHGIIGEVVQYAEKKGVPLSELKLEELRSFHQGFENNVFEVFDPARSVRRKKTYGSTHPDQVNRQIQKARRLLSR